MRPERNHWARVAMYQAAVELLQADARGPGYYPPPAFLNVLEISGHCFEDLLPWDSYRSVSDVDVTDRSDVEELAPADLIVLDQVLEHVLRPHAALELLRGRLKPHGRIFVSTPFLIRVHPAPIDLWRWTREGLGELMLDAGLHDVRTGAWGNKACVIANLEGWWPWTPEADMTNDPYFPVTCWALGTR